MSDQYLKGWDLLYKLIQSDIKKKEDLIVGLVHIVLINCEFKCIGLGASKIVTEHDKCSEVLPTNWNSQTSTYSLRYLKNNNLYNFCALIMEEDIVINLINVNATGVNSIAFSVEKIVRSLEGDSMKDFIPGYGDVVQQARCTLANFSYNKDASTQTTEDSDADAPIFKFQVSGSERVETVRERALPNFSSRSNLAPFSSFVRREMLCDPTNPLINHHGLGISGLHSRRLHCGMRYDPMGAPDVDRRPRLPFEPDSDSLPAPGREDMFM